MIGHDDERRLKMTHAEALREAERFARAQSDEMLREAVTAGLLRGDALDDIDAEIADLRAVHEAVIADLLERARAMLREHCPNGVEPPTFEVTREKSQRGARHG
jgi:hypothetical protein